MQLEANHGQNVVVHWRRQAQAEEGQGGRLAFADEDEEERQANDSYIIRELGYWCRP